MLHHTSDNSTSVGIGLEAALQSELGLSQIGVPPKCWCFLWFWVNYNDLTRPHPKSWFMWGIAPQPPYFSLVKYYNSPRWFPFKTSRRWSCWPRPWYSHPPFEFRRLAGGDVRAHLAELGHQGNRVRPRVEPMYKSTQCVYIYICIICICLCICILQICMCMYIHIHI